MIRLHRPLGLAVAGLLAATAVAQAAGATAPTAAEQSYRADHEGVYAAVECRGAVFTPADYRLLESRIAARAGAAMHAGRQLEMIEAGKARIDRAMSHAGCGADEVEAALIRFDTLRGVQTGKAPKQ
ncbi:hypothetical protein GCM10017083_07320 [Thalassobaculum fulvum]|uniref:Uncharacterized protein n=1 Tax=Thalassobaculum fulvum TaxID=1633335 RepID=A0A918XNL4_9PROT|nr:hypothetical protein [Thalassobaculum fulvum]GHD42361.1 hypothetical protein GCM10017083_07320 [Thalassobaculum fulvum]